MAIVAGKNEETLCEHPHPSLTSMAIGSDGFGYAAAELLDCLMHGGKPPTQPIRLAPHGLVVRESTDFFAVDDPLVAAALAYIAANAHHCLGPDEVAAAAAAKTRTLHNYFHRTIQRPVATEIRRGRIERAKRELAQSNRTLAAIARDGGFGIIQRLYRSVPPRTRRQPRRVS